MSRVSFNKIWQKNLKLKSPVKDKRVFFEFVKKHAITLPKDYEFNREEVHER